ncbi:hypothetical protein [Ruminococcus sp. Marseille-P6503]|uniref:hypothetical protein n=1 Tax=Ruminococcus sp. Marseille-P6503 TaxID=2364796 RepID=UPI000F53DEF4|nr:hypothetical protein [Ruminococcus sp. Marseille-P6503]
MDENELIFQYPRSDQRSLLIENYKNRVTAAHIKQKKLLIFCVLFIVLTIAASSFSNILSVISAFALLAGIFVLKRNSEQHHFLEISAGESKAEFCYYQNGKATLYTIPYDSILASAIDEEKYDNVIIVIDKSKKLICTVIGKNGETYEKPCPEYISFRVKPFSSEQGFFLYYAPKLFGLSTDRLKILNTFGKESEYFNSF